MTGKNAGQVLLEDGTQFLENLHIADTWWSRFRGLQFLPNLPEKTGLLLHPCHSIHTFWMRFPIHVLFLDQHSIIIEIQQNMRPWRVALPKASGIAATLEVPISTELPSLGARLYRNDQDGQLVEIF